VRGFICFDHASAIPEAMAELGELLAAGKMKVCRSTAGPSPAQSSTCARNVQWRSCLAIVTDRDPLQVREDFREGGIETFIDTVNLLFTGGNTGKLMMKIPQ
jgi:NADPH-dependent curcumin reductase CurA